MGQATGAVHGYLVADQARNDSGKFSGLAYIINEIPVPPQTDNPAPANPPLVSTELLVGTEKAAMGSPDCSQGRGRNFRSDRHVFLDPQQLLEWCQRKLGRDLGCNDGQLQYSPWAIVHQTTMQRV